MRYITLVTIVFASLVLIMSPDASAQLTGNKAISLTGNGYTISQDVTSDTTIDLLFIINQIKNNINFGLQSGLIVIGNTELTISDFSGSSLKDGKLFRFSSKATDQAEDKFTVSMLGRLIDKTSDTSFYSVTGTITDSSKKVTKMIFVTKVLEFIPKTTGTEKTGTTVKILKGSSDPGQRTYIEQTGGFSFKYFSEDRLTIATGGTITFVNEDTASHSLKSGTANYASHNKPFTADGKISSEEIAPGSSWSVTFNEPGFYRLFDEDYQWMDVTVFVKSPSSSETLGTNVMPLN